MLVRFRLGVPAFLEQICSKTTRFSRQILDTTPADLDRLDRTQRDRVIFLKM